MRSEKIGPGTRRQWSQNYSSSNIPQVLERHRPRWWTRTDNPQSKISSILQPRDRILQHTSGLGAPAIGPTQRSTPLGIISPHKKTSTHTYVPYMHPHTTYPHESMHLYAHKTQRSTDASAYSIYTPGDYGPQKQSQAQKPGSHKHNCGIHSINTLQMCRIFRSRGLKRTKTGPFSLPLGFVSIRLQWL